MLWLTQSKALARSRLVITIGLLLSKLSNIVVEILLRASFAVFRIYKMEWAKFSILFTILHFFTLEPYLLGSKM